MMRIRLPHPCVRSSHPESGFALLGVFVLSLGILLFGLSFMLMTGYEASSSQKMLDSERAFWLAEAGQSRLLHHLENERNRPYDKRTTVYDGKAGPDGGTYTVTIHPDPANFFNVQKTFVVESIGESRGITRRVLRKLAMTSFALYAYFTDDEIKPGGGPIWFVNNNIIEGPAHTNGTFRIWGSPEFQGSVTSGSDHMIGHPDVKVYDPSGWPTANGRNDPTFRKGFQLGVGEIPLPQNTQSLAEVAGKGGLMLSGGTGTWDLQFGRRGDTAAGIEERGWYRYRSPTNTWISGRLADLDEPVIYANGNVRVEGKVDGEVTVGSRDDIRISDDLVYWDSDANGTPLAGADDLLGLVAGRNIVFENTPATNNLKVNAVMMALDTSIFLENYLSYGYKGPLTVWGGLIQKYRGVVSRHNRLGVITRGYAKNYHYDTRVTARTPPYFPFPGVYSVLDWKEGWQSVSFL